MILAFLLFESNPLTYEVMNLPDRQSTGLRCAQTRRLSQNNVNLQANKVLGVCA